MKFSAVDDGIRNRDFRSFHSIYENLFEGWTVIYLYANRSGFDENLHLLPSAVFWRVQEEAFPHSPLIIPKPERNKSHKYTVLSQVCSYVFL